MIDLHDGATWSVVATAVPAESDIPVDYTVLREGTEKVIGVPDINALVEYFKMHSPVPAGPQNRIIRID